MKTQHRHQLKQNAFAENVARVVDFATANRDLLIKGLSAIVLVLVIGGSYLLWKRNRDDQAGAMLGIAMAIEQTPLGTALPTSAAMGSSFPSEKARNEAALAAFQQVVAAYPTTQAGNAARYHSGLTLRELGRFPEAAVAFQQTIDQGAKTIYGTVARVGLAEALVDDKQYDKAVVIYTDLSGQRDGALPIDGVLIQLARACAKAGKTAEARAAYKRVVDEFAESAYVAVAKKEMALLG